jgi:regulator of PEP synthase PpsR (kinase-PPPase family)
MQRTVFFISDSTAITAETLGHSLMTQFPGVKFRQIRRPFILDEEKARRVVEEINAVCAKEGTAAVVFNTIVVDELNAILRTSNGITIDLYSAFLGTLSDALGIEPQHMVGQAHGVADAQRYEDRIDATNYAMTHDDGVSLDYGEADLILVGVSRSGKTPTCLYMALNFGVKAANYPLTEEDLERQRLPPFLRSQKRKIVGLMIDPDRLAQIRETRRPGSRYASMRQCHWEVDSAESLLRMEGVPIFHTTHSSIEEIASRVLMQLGLQREMF